MPIPDTKYLVSRTASRVKSVGYEFAEDMVTRVGASSHAACYDSGMGGVKKIPPEGGSGGKRGHSSMEHWVMTAEIKDAARKVRRRCDKEAVEEGRQDAASETVSPGEGSPT